MATGSATGSGPTQIPIPWVTGITPSGEKWSERETNDLPPSSVEFASTPLT